MSIEHREDPIEKFNQWWRQAIADSPLKQKSAVCVSTVNPDGFPTGRFLDLKAADERGFVFCTHLDSHKALDIERNGKTALTLWWEHVGFQIRVLGTAARLDEEEAVTWWNTRSRDAQLTTACFQQSRPLESQEALEARFQEARAVYGKQAIPKPENWGGYRVKPVSIEFLTFKESRLHLREWFEATSDGWKKSLLQP